MWLRREEMLEMCGAQYLLSHPLTVADINA